MAGSKVKGHQHRVINTPGFHVHSKYDLHGFRDFQDKKKHKQAEPNLPLTPMLDMMSILIIYLLMNFSATGEIFFVSRDGLKIPDAAHGRPLESAALVSLHNGKVYLDAQPKEGQDSVKIEESGEELPQIRARLQQLRIIEETVNPGKNFKGMVNIQADNDTPLAEVKKVMAVLISEGWTNINFAVEGTGGAPTGEGSAALSSEAEE